MSDNQAEKNHDGAVDQGCAKTLSDQTAHARELAERLASVTTQLGKVYGDLAALDEAKVAMELLGAKRLRRFFIDEHGWITPTQFAKAFESLKQKRNEYCKFRDDLVLEMRRTGIALAAAIESLDIDARSLKRMMLKPTREGVERAYPVVRRIECELDVRESKREMQQGQTAGGGKGGDWVEPRAKDPRRRARRKFSSHPLTLKQIEAQTLFVSYQGNIARAADKMGVSRATFVEHLNAGRRKIGRSALPKPKTIPLPTDHRSQIDVSRDDEGDDDEAKV